MERTFTFLIFMYLIFSIEYVSYSQSEVGIFKGTVQSPEGETLYSRMNIYNSENLDILISENVSAYWDETFEFELPAGEYKVYIRAFVPNSLAIEYDISIQNDKTIDTILVIPDRSPEAYFDNLYSSKGAVFKGGDDNFFLRIKINPQFSPEKIYVFNEFNFMTSLTGKSLGKYELNDDGVLNDEIAGDGVYTSENIGVGENVELYRENKIGSIFISQFQLVVNGELRHFSFDKSLASEVAVVDKSVEYGMPVKLANDIYANDYVVNVLRSDTVKVEHSAAVAMQYDMNIVLKYFPDEFDFLFEFSHTRYSVNHVHIDVFQDVQNIGSELIDERELYGPTQRLKGCQLFSGKGAEMPLQHELLHQWGNDMHELFGNPRGHNGYTSIWGVHGGFDMEKLEIINDTLIKINDYAYSPLGSSDLGVDYADLELYNMGLLPFSDLREEYYSLKDAIENYDGIFQISGIDTITKQEIIDFYGERIPSFEDSQKDFTSVFVVASREPISEAMFAFYTYIAKGWEDNLERSNFKSFAQSTGDRGTMTTKLPPVISSVAPIQKTDIIISPNPVVDNFTIELANGIRNTFQLKIYNFEGKLVFSDEINKSITINDKFVKGVYSVVLIDANNNRVTKKLIFE